jgi:uncharacterized protein YqiB (DUF1249 family)
MRGRLTSPERAVNAGSPGATRWLPNSFESLLALYADNHRRLCKLAAVRDFAPGRYRSRSPGHADLVLDLLEQWPYTTLMRLSLDIPGGTGPALEPESYWRVYHDAMQAEVTHCRFPEHETRLFAPDTPAKQLAAYRRRMNSFANKWLEHLLDSGHGGERWQPDGPVPEAIREESWAALAEAER